LSLSFNNILSMYLLILGWLLTFHKSVYDVLLFL
jgi:hypothetical protein